MAGFFDLQNMMTGVFAFGVHRIPPNEVRTVYLTDEDETKLPTPGMVNKVRNVRVAGAIDARGVYVARDVDPGDAYAKENLPVVEVITASRVVAAEDAGKVFRYEGSGSIDLTIPANLPEMVNVAVGRWGTGAINIVAGSGATNRSALTAVSAQYKTASILVMKNNGALTAAEFTVGEV